MNTTNQALLKFLQERNPQLTKEAAAQGVQEIEDSFVKAAVDGGIKASELLKIAQESPEQWNQMVNSYVSDLVVTAAEQEKQAALHKQAETEQMAKVAEDIASGERIAHSFWNELAKLAEAAMKQAEDDEKDDEKKDEKKDDEKKDEPPKDEKKDEGGHGIPPALAAAMNKEEKKEEAKEGSALPADVRELRSAIRIKVANKLPISGPEEELLGLCKLAEAGHPINWDALRK